MRILGSRDCGNSPKNLFVQEMAIAFETGTMPSGSITDDLSVDVPTSDISITLVSALPWLKDQPAPIEIQVLHAIAHGRTGAANGFSTLEDGSKRCFSYVFEFKNTTAKCVAKVYRYS